MLRGTWLAGAVLGALSVLATGGAWAEQAKVVAVKFHADWCGSCEVIQPAIDEARASVNSPEVAFVTLDLTDEATTADAMELAEAAGITEAYEAFAPKTGFVLLIDTQTGQAVAKMTKTHSAADLEGLITSALTGELEPIEAPAS
ncbi:MAG: thioredoxin family protein [Planctomycetota bacterium]